MKTLRTAILIAGAALSAAAGAAPLAKGDPVRGEAIYSRCQACHALA